MSRLFMIVAVLAAGMAQAQKADTVITNGGMNDVYYSFTNDEVAVVDRATWDIGFITAAFDASIIINENAGVELYVYSTDTSVWDAVDTTGMEWANLHNSTATWSLGAFANQNEGHPDYGWGKYNGGTHNVDGKQILILKEGNGNYSQIMIKQMNTAGEYIVKIAEIGGANTEYITFNKKDAEYKDKNFVLFSVSDRMVVNGEPNADDWDILFTRYTNLINTGNGFVPYPVSGVKVNAQYQVAMREGMDVSSNDTNGLVWTDSICAIGSDWKSFNMNTFQYDITSNLAFFVRTTSGAVWKIYFTQYKGSSEGGYYFNIEKIRSGASVKESHSLMTSVYPNPASGEFFIENQEHEQANITIFNNQGSVVATSEVAAMSTLSLNTYDMTTGMYFVVLKTSNAVAAKRLIVE